MSIAKPYRRAVRQLVDGSYQGSGHGRYVEHPLYASSPSHYLRAFQVLQKDVLTLFDYVEPADANWQCYSHRILELHARCCFEVEANFKAILTEHGYPSSRNWTMEDYQRLNDTHHLSSYEVKLPVWAGDRQTQRPFAAWSSSERLLWYQAYNAVKHSRHSNFGQANLGNLIEAVCGLVALISAQFLNLDFGPSYILGDGPSDGFDFATGGYFLVKYPDDWPVAERYEFDWEVLKNSEPDPFQTFTF
jgi:hypothetical protein